jgi:N-methylhydantoinase A
VSEVRDGDGSQAVVKSRRIFFDGEWLESKVYDRALLRAGDRFTGPGLITEYSATTVVLPGWSVCVDRMGNLVIAIG